MDDNHKQSPDTLSIMYALGEIKAGMLSLNNSFSTLREATEANSKDIRELTTWKDTFNGKIIGAGAVITIIASVIAFILSNFINVNRTTLGFQSANVSSITESK